MKAKALTTVGLLVALVLLVPPLFAYAQSPPRFLGGVNFEKYCNNIEPGAKGALEAQNGYGWICGNKFGQKMNVWVSVTQACIDTHHNPRAVDFLKDYGNPYTWECYDNAEELGEVNFASYCNHLGHIGFKVVGDKAYNMYCITQDNHLVSALEFGYSADAACKWTWGNEGMKGRLMDYNNNNPKTAWKCYW